LAAAAAIYVNTNLWIYVAVTSSHIQ